MSKPVFFDRQGFKHATLQLTGSAEALGKIIGNATMMSIQLS